MKKVEIHAYSREEADMKAFEEHGITVIRNVTNWWSRNGSPKGAAMDQFIADNMWKKNMYSVLGAGCIICIQKPNYRLPKWPIVKNYIKRGKGRIQLSKVVELRRSDTDEVLGTATSKRDALPKIRKLVQQHKTDMYAVTLYYASEIDMEVKYVPHKNDAMGKYIVFGIDESDVRLYRRRNRGLPDE